MDLKELKKKYLKLTEENKSTLDISKLLAESDEGWAFLEEQIQKRIVNTVKKHGSISNYIISLKDEYNINIEEENNEKEPNNIRYIYFLENVIYFPIQEEQMVAARAINEVNTSENKITKIFKIDKYEVNMTITREITPKTDSNEFLVKLFFSFSVNNDLVDFFKIELRKENNLSFKYQLKENELSIICETPDNIELPLLITIDIDEEEDIDKSLLDILKNNKNSIPFDISFN